jgi:hypothetical protein
VGLGTAGARSVLGLAMAGVGDVFGMSGSASWLVR